jgi:HSP20 family protein
MWLSLLDLLRQNGGAPMLGPELTMADEGHALTLRAPLPGIDPKSVQIQVREQWLAIGGHRTVEEQTEGPDFVRYQSALSQFYREVPLPCRIVPTRVTARWEPAGTLVVTLPKA